MKIETQHKRRVVMKKFFAAAAIALMLTGSMTAYAGNPSPEPETTTEPGTPTKDSPKTADFNIVFVEGLGIVLLGAAGTAYVLSRKRA